MVRTDKPWGHEELIECNDHYVVKKLFMKSGHCCSLQYHEKKHETIYVLSGMVKFSVGDSVDTLIDLIIFSGGYYVIAPLKIHRMYGITDCEYLEASTTQLDDVVRIKDEYGRSTR